MSLPADVLPGMALPRVRCAPAVDRSEGDDAVWLAASYGLRADHWQAEILRDWLRVCDGRWAASRCGTAVPRQNGKNGALEIRELYGMVALAERFLHTAHEVKTARKAFARLLEFFDNPRQYPELAGMVREIRRTNGQEAIVLDNGGSVEFIARSRGSGRGFSVDVLVADEAQELTEDAWAALLPTISASNNPQVILTGTPPPPGAAGEVFLRMRRSGVAGDDDRLAWAEYSCADDLESVDLDDPNEWAADNPALGTRLRLQTVADERAVMDRETFARERLGWWQPVEARSAAIDPGAWAALADPQAERGADPTFAVATAPDRSWSAVAVAWKRPDGLPQVMLADYRPTTAWVAERVAELRSRWGGRVLVDAASDGLVGDAERPKQADRAKADNGLSDAVTAGTVRHGNEAALNTAVRASRWRPLGDTRVLDRKGSADISPLVAAALAVHGAMEDDGGVQFW
jgi:hypothetical protein